MFTYKFSLAGLYLQEFPNHHGILSLEGVAKGAIKKETLLGITILERINTINPNTLLLNGWHTLFRYHRKIILQSTNLVMT